MAVNRVEYFGETLVDLSDSTVTEENLGEREIAYNKAGERITGTAKIQKRVYINNDQNETSISVGSLKEFSVKIPESGIYAVSASFEWDVSNANLSGYADLFDSSLSLVVAVSRNSLTAGGSHNLFAVSEFNANDIVKLRIRWNGGSGSATAKKIRFRLSKISN